MAIQFYYGSGSPFAWRAWLALEHKALPYELKVMSFTGGDLSKPEFVALNPRKKVPTLVDDGFALYESAAIVEYLDDAYRTSGSPLFPTSAKARATARRQIREIDEYFVMPMERLLDELWSKKPAEWDAEAVAKDKARVVREFGVWEAALTGNFLTGNVGAVDYALYPLIALTLRLEAKKKPDLGIGSALGPRMKSWMGRIEALPYFDKTYPPHWKT